MTKTVATYILAALTFSAAHATDADLDRALKECSASIQALSSVLSTLQPATSLDSTPAKSGMGDSSAIYSMEQMIYNKNRENFAAQIKAGFDQKLLGWNNDQQVQWAQFGATQLNQQRVTPLTLQQNINLAAPFLTYDFLSPQNVYALDHTAYTRILQEGLQEIANMQAGYPVDQRHRNFLVFALSKNTPAQNRSAVVTAFSNAIANRDSTTALSIITQGNIWA